MGSSHRKTLEASQSHKKAHPSQASMSLNLPPPDLQDRLVQATDRIKMIVMKVPSWTAVRTRKQPKEQTARCYLLEMPTEILLEIVSHLTLIPEAVFALTCKRMYAISGSILSSKALQFPRDFAPLFHHYRNTHNFISPRWQLLTLLENTRWRNCSKCLKQHPRAAFSSRDLRRKAENRTCNVGELAGVVDICPCKKLTFRDKLDLVDHLRVRKLTLQALKLEFGSMIHDDRYLWHSCTEKYGPSEMTISVFPELNDDDQLIVRTEYQLTTESGQVGKEEFMTPRFGCAHRSVDLWLSGVHQTTICRLFDKFCSSCQRISVCGACNTTLKCPRKQPYNSLDSKRVTYSFWTERSLGGASAVPDAAWGNQRIHPAEPSVGVENCNELCPWTVREHPPLTYAPTLGEEIIQPGMNTSSLNSLYSSIRML